jgi:type IV pilus assembly protein PilN
MIRINLLPAKDTERALGQRQQRALAALGLTIALLIMIVPYAIQGRRLSAIETETAQVQEEIRRYDERVKEVRDLDRLKEELQTKLRIIEDLNHKRIGPARVLGDLSIATPDNLWVNDFKETGGGATLSGMALDNQTIAFFMRQLQTSPYFFNVDLVETTQSMPARGVSTAVPQAPNFKRFIINAQIDYFGRGGKPAVTEAKPGAPGAPGAENAPAANAPAKPAPNTAS